MPEREAELERDRRQLVRLQAEEQATLEADLSRTGKSYREAVEEWRPD
jgi:hypothetical protein